MDTVGPDGQKYKTSAESGHKVEWFKEENYMFRLKDLGPEVLKWILRGSSRLLTNLNRNLFERTKTTSDIFRQTDFTGEVWIHGNELVGRGIARLVSFTPTVKVVMGNPSS